MHKCFPTHETTKLVHCLASYLMPWEKKREPTLAPGNKHLPVEFIMRLEGLFNSCLILGGE